MAQVFLLGYVSFIVPLRTCFEIETSVGDSAFWIDLVRGNENCHFAGRLSAAVCAVCTTVI